MMMHDAASKGLKTRRGGCKMHDDRQTSEFPDKLIAEAMHGPQATHGPMYKRLMYCIGLIHLAKHELVLEGLWI